MKKAHLTVTLTLAGIAIGGIFMVQLFWFKRAFDLKDKQFNQSVQIALTEVALELLQYRGHSTVSSDAISQPATNYFIVMVNDVIDAELLRQLLIRSFLRRSIRQDFEFGIYDCQTESMVYGHYVSFDEENDGTRKGSVLPRWDRENYYFIVHFPGKEANLMADMGIWLFSTGVLLVVLLFFAYAFFALLQQQKLSRLQKDFINNMTHEIKTPLTGISLAAEGLHTMVKEERQLKYVQVILEETRKLRAHTQRILEAAVTEEHGLQLKKHPIELKDFIQNLSLGWSDQIARANGTLHLHLPTEPVVVSADEVHLSNALSGLIDNAIKYSGPMPKVTLLLNKRNTLAILQVCDEGPGIPQEEQKKIFQRFYRISKGDVQRSRGFGLGLHYILTVMNAHRGKVELKSAPRQTIFSLTLPV